MHAEEGTQQPITRDEFEKNNVDSASMTAAEFMEERRVHGVFKEREWFESVVAVNRYDQQGNVTEIRLHPVELHYEGEWDADRGIPRIASSETAKRVLARLQTLSQPYGTKIDIQGDIGFIRVK